MRKLVKTRSCSAKLSTEKENCCLLLHDFWTEYLLSLWHDNGYNDIWLSPQKIRKVNMVSVFGKNGSRKQSQRSSMKPQMMVPCLSTKLQMTVPKLVHKAWDDAWCPCSPIKLEMMVPMFVHEASDNGVHARPQRLRGSSPHALSRGHCNNDASEDGARLQCLEDTTAHKASDGGAHTRPQSLTQRWMVRHWLSQLLSHPLWKYLQNTFYPKP